MTNSAIASALQEISPSALIELFQLELNELQHGVNETYYFHAGTNTNDYQELIWNAQPYMALPIEVDGFEYSGQGTLPRPKMRISNLLGTITALILTLPEGLEGAKLTRIRTLARFIDAANFKSDEYLLTEDDFALMYEDDTFIYQEVGNPFGTPDPLAYISKEKYLISQKIMENSNLIQFELITPFDLQSLESASRAIYGKYCYWQYRGSGCNYKGDLICKENDLYFSKNPKSIKYSNGSYREVVDPASGKIISFADESEAIEYYSWREDKNYEAGDVVVIANIDLNGLKDPPYTWFVCITTHLSSRLTYPNKSTSFWEKDGCSKGVEACKKRFLKITDQKLNGYNNDFEVMMGILPFGGFPGTDKFKYE